MTRRDAVALIALSSSALAFRSCSERQESLAALTATLGRAVALLATLQGDKELAERLRQHTELAVQAINNWKPGMPAADAIRAINQLIDDLKLFPADSKYKALIVLALGTAANIIDRLNSQGAGGEKPHTDVHLTDPPQNDQQFKAHWDAIRASSVGMEQVPIL